MRYRIPILASYAAFAWLATGSAFADGTVEELVSFATHDGLILEGVLSYPETEPGPFPGMLLIPGSGLHDADVTIDEPELEITNGTQKLFLGLARDFARQGWAVLRWNKRGASFDHKHDRPEVLHDSSLADLVEDGRAALRALHGHPRVAARPLVIYAHSEGTAIAIRLAREQGDIDLLVLVGSVSGSFSSLLEYQLVDRNLAFLLDAADANRDGAVTWSELDALDGRHGLFSVYLRNCAELLYETRRSPDGTLQVKGINRATDIDGDGRLRIREEIEPVLRREADELLELARSGALGRYLASLLGAEPSRSLIAAARARFLFVHGELDVQTPLTEALDLIQMLERAGRTDYDLLVFPGLGHSLSKPNDTYDGDGGLTVLDNFTLNAARKRTRRQLLRRIELALAVE